MIHTLHLLSCDKALDLGCGTGLTGIVLREVSGHLTGVDIAEKMLNHAREKCIYDRLIHQELLSFLHEEKECYDLIVAADVLPYFGDLTEVFSLVKMRLDENGCFIFTTEINEKNQWALESSARFSHSIPFIEHLSQTHEFTLVKREKIPGRIQNQTPLTLMLYCLKKGKATTS